MILMSVLEWKSEYLAWLTWFKIMKVIWQKYMYTHNNNMCIMYKLNIIFNHNNLYLIITKKKIYKGIKIFQIMQSG